MYYVLSNLKSSTSPNTTRMPISLSVLLLNMYQSFELMYDAQSGLPIDDSQHLTSLVTYSMEYGSTPYIGMAPKKMAAHCMCTKWYVQNSALDIVISFYGPYLSFSSVFISNKTLSVAGEHRWKYHISKSLNEQIVYFFLSFFSNATTILTEAITMIQTRRSSNSSGVLHPHHGVLKQIKLFSSDSQALEASTCCYTLFHSVLCCVTVVTPTPETQARVRAA